MTSQNPKTPPHSLDSWLLLEGPGGLPFLEVRNALACARISLHGGQVLSFRPLDAAADVLFVSEQAVYQTGKAIRGGVPVCWPWFGGDPEKLGRPAHGLARIHVWELRRAEDLPGGETQIELGLTDCADTLALWPHAFDLTLLITVGTTLGLALTTRNTGSEPLKLTQALHSYFEVGDIEHTQVTGLDGCHYIDKAAGAAGAVKLQTGAVRFAGEVDRIYTDVPDALAVVDGSLQRRIGLSAQGSRTAVVWNPGEAVAARMVDLNDDGYRRFVCVETANAANEVITVPPGGEHRMAVQIAATPY